MGKILVPDQPNLSGMPEPKSIKATVIFQDTNYTFMRNKDGKEITQEDIFNLPIHLIFIGLGMLDARQYIPRIGKDTFLATLKKIKKQFDDTYKVQRAIATNMHVETAKKSTEVADHGHNL